MKGRADWLAWGLQFIVGLPIGALLGMALVFSRGRRRGGGMWMTPEYVPFVIWGAALLCAALASYFGDRLWGSSYRVIAPDEMRHSNASRWLSVSTGAIGVGLIFFALGRHFRIF